MMANLFSSFDPTSSIMNLPMNWLSTFVGISLTPLMFWAMPARASFLWNLMTNKLHTEFKTLLGPSNSSSTIMFLSIFIFIMFNNLLGLTPYVFTSTSHLALTLTLALPTWLAFILFGWINHTNHMFAHLVPMGTPKPLMPFMVLIETVSNIIRPATLAVRLAANMIAGHLLLTLLGNTGPNCASSFILTLILLSQLALISLEMAVAIIQSYVFAALSTLYASEVK